VSLEASSPCKTLIFVLRKFGTRRRHVEVDPANEKEHVLRHAERPLLSEARDGFDWDNAEAYRAKRNRSTGRVR
jgi:hypothetical protein